MGRKHMQFTKNKKPATWNRKTAPRSHTYTHIWLMSSVHLAVCINSRPQIEVAAISDELRNPIHFQQQKKRKQIYIFWTRTAMTFGCVMCIPTNGRTKERKRVRLTNKR